MCKPGWRGRVAYVHAGSKPVMVNFIKATMEF